MRYFKKIIGENIYLSPINMDDYETYTEWINDLEISINLGNAHQIFNLDKEKEITEQLVENNFAIIDKAGDKLIGNCGIFDIDQVNKHGELGILIGEKDYWDKGIGKEAISLILDYGFNLLNLHNIMLKVYSFNKRGIKCYKKLGFKEIGKRRESRQVAGEKYDEIYMDILSSEFKDSKISVSQLPHPNQKQD